MSSDATLPEIVATQRERSARFITGMLTVFALLTLYPVWLFGAEPLVLAGVGVAGVGYGLSHVLVRKGALTLGMLIAVTCLSGQYVAAGLGGGAPLGPAPYWPAIAVLAAASTLPSRWLWATLGLTLTSLGIRSWLGGLDQTGRVEHATGAALAIAAFAICLHRVLHTERAIAATTERCAERTRATAGPCEVNEYHRLIADHTDDLFALVDGQAYPVYLNPSHARLFGQPLEELSRSTLNHLLVPDSREALARAISEALDNARSSAEVSLCGSNGITRTFDMKLTRVESQAGPLLALTSRDITERRQLQQRLMASERMESLGRLAGSIAHDFNNLLMVIGGAAEMARHTAKDIPEAVEDLDSVLEATHNASNLTRQLLTFSRKQVVTLTELDLAAALFGIREFIERLVGKQIRLVFDFEPNCPKVMLAAVHLEQVAMDLAMNARDAMPQGGQLTFALRRVDLCVEASPLPTESYAELSVQDQGTGIPEDVCPHLFEPLFTTKGDAGTGLGLPTCHNIVAESHGTISVESAPGQGTTFRIRLPCSTQSSLRPSHRSSPLPRAIHRVLVVDDEPAPRETAARMLRASGFDVVVASSLAEARRYVEDPTIALDAVLTDVVLSGELGTDLLEDCRKRRPKMRIVVMSGYSPNPEASEKVMAVRAKFLPKPFNRQELLRALGGESNAVASTGESRSIR